MNASSITSISLIVIVYNFPCKIANILLVSEYNCWISA